MALSLENEEQGSAGVESAARLASQVCDQQRRPLLEGGEFRTSVDVDLRAFHTDPINDPAINEGRHEHVWNVRLVFKGDVFRDARTLRAGLIHFLAPFQGQDLPWWSAEDIAKAVLTIGTADPIGCVITRPGYRAEAWRA